jgi:hypothetical protein
MASSLFVGRTRRIVSRTALEFDTRRRIDPPSRADPRMLAWLFTAGAVAPLVSIGDCMSPGVMRLAPSPSRSNLRVRPRER